MEMYYSLGRNGTIITRYCQINTAQKETSIEVPIII